MKLTARGLLLLRAGEWGRGGLVELCQEGPAVSHVLPFPNGSGAPTRGCPSGDAVGHRVLGTCPGPCRHSEQSHGFLAAVATGVLQAPPLVAVEGA